MTETTWEVREVGELLAVAGELALIWKQNKNTEAATVVALSGDLGAGKTTFVKQIAQILGVQETVNSPTFVIMKSYETNDKDFSNLVHIDAYRIEDPSEMQALKWEQVLAMKDTLLFIEWPEKISTILPNNIIRVSLEALPHSVHKITHHGQNN